MAKGYRTHEALTADVKMYVKMFLRAFVFGLLLQCICLVIFIKKSYNAHMTVEFDTGESFVIPFKAVKNYYFPGIKFMGRESKDSVPREMTVMFGGRTRIPHTEFVDAMDFYFGKEIKGFENAIAWTFYLSFLSYLLSAAYIIFFLATSGRMTNVRFIRGASKIPLSKLKHALQGASEKADGPIHPNINICGLRIPRDLETKHFLLMGTPVTAKSVLFNQAIGQVIERMRTYQSNEKCIVYDVKGEFLSKHATKNDYIFYPFDSRSVFWSFFNEIHATPDFDVVSRIIFSHEKETNADPFWNNAAKDVFVAGLRYLHKEGTTTNADIWKFFSQGVEDIARAVKTLPLEFTGALKHIQHTGGGPAASVVSTLTEKISWFQYITDMDGDFSFRRFVRDSGGKNLYLLNVKNYAAAFRPLMTFVFDVLIRETLSLPDTNNKENRRIWFCIDEIGSLNQISVLFDLLTVARSKGGCLIVANQDLGKIEDIYGRANRRTFYNNFNTDFILRLNDPDTAEFISRSIGEREIIKKSESRSMSPRDMGDRATVSDQDKTEKVMLPSEFMHIPDFHAIVKMSSFGISEVDIPRKFYKEKHEPFKDKHQKDAIR